MQLKLSKSEATHARELQRLGDRVEENYREALADHEARMRRFARYYHRWRNRVDPPPAGEEQKPNFSVPMLQWQTFGRLSKEMQRLLGEDSEVIAKPTGPSDAKKAEKVGRYMTWRLFDSMRITNPLTIFSFRKVLFGRSFALRPWVREEYRTPKGPQLRYEGPGFYPLWPDDVIVPAEDVDNCQQFSWMIRKVRVTPQQLIDGERAGRYFGIIDDFTNVVETADQSGERDDPEQGDLIKERKDEAEGVIYEAGRSGRGRLLILEWYGRWRMLKGSQDASEFNFKRRAIDESEIVVRYAPDLHRVVGIQDLMALYPMMQNRRPFSEASLVKDGSYWSPGFGELLESIEDEASANHQLFTEAGRFSVGPLLFYKPGAGYNPKTFRYEPFTSVPTEDPQGIREVQMRANLEFPIVNGQQLQRYGELVTGESDTALGRSGDRPNDPKTASGTVALIEQGNIRADFDTQNLREDMRTILADFWEMDCDMSPPHVFFRVTEEDAKGLIETKNGGATMTAEERAGKFDFDIEFATSVWSRERNKQTFIALYQLLLANPLVATNPQVLAMVTRQLCKQLGFPELADAIPEPPPIDRPRAPREEWTLILQGEGDDLNPNPADDDDRHIMEHTRQLQESREMPPDRRDQPAERMLVRHVLAHQEQKRTKMALQQFTRQLVDTMAAQQGAGALAPGGPGAGSMAEIQGLQELLPQLFGGGGAPGEMAPPRQ